MITEIKAVCPINEVASVFVRNEQKMGYTCTCPMCISGDICPAFIRDEDLLNNPDGGEPRFCSCPLAPVKKALWNKVRVQGGPDEQSG